MVDELAFQKALSIHNEFMRRLDRHEIPIQTSVPQILTRILECDEEILKFSLGDIGAKLKLFANRVDFTHPELISVFDGILADGQDFSQGCMELLLLAKFAKDQQLNKILPLLGKTIAKETISKSIFRKIDSPQHDRMHVRLLKDPCERKEIRLSKKMQTIDLQSVYKGEDIWNAQPDSFSKFLRFDTAYQDDLAAAEKKVQRYEQMGCSSLANEIRKSISIFRENMEQSHYGFNRIKMTNAAVILAKSLGFTYTPATETANGFTTIRTEAKISVNRNYFGKYNLDPDRIIGFDPYVSEIAGSPIFTAKQQDPYLYQPRVYPLHEFWDIASNELKGIIDLLEAFPDAGGKPIFDHFGIIIPSIALPEQAPKSNIFLFLDERGMTQAFNTQEEAVKALDKILVKGNYLMPIVLGEKDGKCYFLSYFNTKDNEL